MEWWAWTLLVVFNLPWAAAMLVSAYAWVDSHLLHPHEYGD